MARHNTENPQHVDPSDDTNVVFWREEFGVTAEQLIEAVKAVGSDPGQVREHFLHQGSSAGPS